MLDLGLAVAVFRCRLYCDVTIQTRARRTVLFLLLFFRARCVGQGKITDETHNEADSTRNATGRNGLGQGKATKGGGG